MQTDATEEVHTSSVPVFDELATERGNPLTAHDDPPAPTFDLTFTPTEWPDAVEVIGPPPVDPEATLILPLVPGDASALALLSSGALPTPSPEPTNRGGWFYA